MKNHVSLIGRVGQDPEHKNLDNGKQVCSFSLATTEKWKNEQNETREETMWHNIVIWGKSAQIAKEYVKKGNKLAIDGRINYREYTDKEGIKRRITDIVSDEFFLIESKPQ